MAGSKPGGGRSAVGLLNSQTFDLLLSRLDSMEERTHQRFDAIERVFGEHKKEDASVALTVGRHDTYWKITKGVLTTIVGGGGLLAWVHWWK